MQLTLEQHLPLREGQHLLQAVESELGVAALDLALDLLEAGFDPLRTSARSDREGHDGDDHPQQDPEPESPAELDCDHLPDCSGGDPNEQCDQEGVHVFPLVDLRLEEPAAAL